MQRAREVTLRELELGGVADPLVFTCSGLTRHLGRVALRPRAREAKPSLVYGAGGAGGDTEPKLGGNAR